MAEEELAELLVRYNSGMYKAGFPWDDAPRAVPSDASNDGWYGPEGRNILASHNPQRTQGCAGRISRFAFRGSCGSPEKAQASARVDVPTAPSNRHSTDSPATCSRLGAQEMLPNLLKDVDEQTIFEEEGEEEQPSEQNRPPEVGVETCGEAGCPVHAEQTWSHRFLVA